MKSIINFYQKKQKIEELTNLLKETKITPKKEINEKLEKMKYISFKRWNNTI